MTLVGSLDLHKDFRIFLSETFAFFHRSRLAHPSTRGDGCHQMQEKSRRPEASGAGLCSAASTSLLFLVPPFLHPWKEKTLPVSRHG
jgi:hypothetical protein